MAAHEKEGAIKCEGQAAVAVLLDGDWICARCGEKLTVLHEAQLLAAVGDGGAAMAHRLGASEHHARAHLRSRAT